MGIWRNICQEWIRPSGMVVQHWSLDYSSRTDKLATPRPEIWLRSLSLARSYCLHFSRVHVEHYWAFANAPNLFKPAAEHVFCQQQLPYMAVLQNALAEYELLCCTSAGGYSGVASHMPADCCAPTNEGKPMGEGDREGGMGWVE